MIQTDFGILVPPFPLSGDTDAVFFLANLWKDFHLGLFSPYVGAGVGTALLGIDGTYLGGAAGRDDTSLAFAAQLGAGVRVGITDRLAVDAGYRFKMAVDANLKTGGPSLGNSTLTLYDHIAQVGLSYAMGSDAQVMPADGGDPSQPAWYVSVFGGAAFPENTGVDYVFAYSVNAKDGFTLGGAIGTHRGSCWPRFGP